jgi:hypothetical protein
MTMHDAQRHARRPRDRPYERQRRRQSTLANRSYDLEAIGPAIRRRQRVGLGLHDDF